METFYRVQDDAGIGPYQSRDNKEMLYSHSYAGFDHPTPTINGYHMKEEDRSAFRTMQDLFCWFGGWLPGLLTDGYRVVKVSGTVRYEDKYQVVLKINR